MKNSPKKKRHPNYCRVKIHRSYSVEEIAELFGIHKNTVRGWIKVGLTVIGGKRSMLVLGLDLREFLQARRAKNKRPCKPGELYCFKCRAPKLPEDGIAYYSPVTDKYGNLTAICPDCNSIINRCVSLARIDQDCGTMEITFPQALPRLVESNKSTVNSDLRQER